MKVKSKKAKGKSEGVGRGVHGVQDWTESADYADGDTG